MYRLIESEADRRLFTAYVKAMALPVTVKVVPGRDRSIEQNRLSWLWYGEIAEQLDGWTVREARRYCKHRFGVPILLVEDAEFARTWEVIGPLPYQKRLVLMETFPVTSRMTTRQFSQYLDEVLKHFTEQGVELTQPEDMACLDA